MTPHIATPIITQPAKEQHKKLKVGETLHLSVEAKCSPGALDYCWFHEQQPLVQPNSGELTLTNITTGHRGTTPTPVTTPTHSSFTAGTYHCKVTNPYINAPKVAFAVSQPVQVEVCMDEQPPQSNGIHRQGK